MTGSPPVRLSANRTITAAGFGCQALDANDDHCNTEKIRPAHRAAPVSPGSRADTRARV